MIRIVVAALLVLVGAHAPAAEINCERGEWRELTAGEVIEQGIADKVLAFAETIRSIKAREYEIVVRVTDCPRFWRSMRLMKSMPKPFVQPSYAVFGTVGYFRSAEPLDLARVGRALACSVRTGAADQRDPSDLLRHQTRVCMLEEAHKAQDAEYATWLVRTLDETMPQTQAQQ